MREKCVKFRIISKNLLVYIFLGVDNEMYFKINVCILILYYVSHFI